MLCSLCATEEHRDLILAEPGLLDQWKWNITAVSLTSPAQQICSSLCLCLCLLSLLLWRDAQRSAKICQWESTLASSEMSEERKKGFAWSRDRRQTMPFPFCWNGTFLCAACLYIFFSAQTQKENLCPARHSRVYHIVSAQEQGRFSTSPFLSTVTAVWGRGGHWCRMGARGGENPQEGGRRRRCGDQGTHVPRVWLATLSILHLELG